MKHERNTKLQTHGEMDPHAHFRYCTLSALVHPIIHGIRSLITFSTSKHGPSLVKNYVLTPELD